MDGVSLMRARLMMKLVSLSVLLVMTVLTARSCGGSSHSSPLDPTNLARNGLSGLCANQEAVQAASGATSGGATLQLPGNDAALAKVAGLSGTSFNCTTTTTSAAGGY